MPEKKFVASIDQGTTSSRCIIWDKSGLPVCSDQREHAQIFPRPGWVEHDAAEIWARVGEVIRGALASGGVSPDEIAAIGITNQRETVVIWDRITGKPVHNAIVWQCMRTQDFCAEWLKTPGWGQDRLGRGKVKDITGLLINPYFSGTKIKWMLDSTPGARERASRGDLLFGNIDTWLIWNLTGGPNGGVHVTDVSNASRTLLMDIRTLEWSGEMTRFLDIPPAMLPKIMPSSALYGNTTPDGPFGAEIPVAGDLGDQQAALFGQSCFGRGETKNTYGTGCFMLMNVGDAPVFSDNGLLSTAAYKLGDEKCVYALEGSVAIAGAAIQWLRDNLRIVDESQDSEYLANKVDDSGGVYFVPAFSGLYAPYWDTSARGAIVGLTRYIRKEHIVRATLESICYETRDMVEAMNADSGVPLAALKVDGGAAKNSLLMQMQSDILGARVTRPAINEATALGTAYAAGLSVGFWKNTGELPSGGGENVTFSPGISDKKREEGYRGWKKAIEKSRGWVNDDERGAV